MTSHSEFLAPRLTPACLDTFLVRRSILEALQQVLPTLKGTLLDVGCGYMPYKPLFCSEYSLVDQYVGLDLAQNKYHKPDIEWDGQTIPLADASVDCAIATEVLEHCPEPEMVMREILRVLKPGGVFFLTVPFLWSLHDVPHDEYRYTPFSLERHLKNSGFAHIELNALGGWDASLAQMLGLWVCRRPMSDLKHKILSYIVFPIIWFLIKLDQPPSDFYTHPMITGISGTAVKA